MMPDKKTETTAKRKVRSTNEGAIQSMDSTAGTQRKATPPPVKKAGTKKTSTANKKAKPLRTTVNPKETSASIVKPCTTPVFLTSPQELESVYPHHLKWQEGGISFELHSTDSSFMNRQAWRVQQAVAGLSPHADRSSCRLPLEESNVPAMKHSSVLTPGLATHPGDTSQHATVNRHYSQVAPSQYTPQPKMYYVPQPLPEAPHEWLRQVQHALHASHHPKTDDLNTEDIQAWLNATEARVAHLNIPKARLTPRQSMPEPQDSMQHIVASTFKAFKQETTTEAPPSSSTPSQKQTAPASIQPILQEASTTEITTLVAERPEPSGYASVELPIATKPLTFDAALQNKIEAIQAHTSPPQVVEFFNETPTHKEPAPKQMPQEPPSIFNTMLRGIHASMGYGKESTTNGVEQVLTTHEVPLKLAKATQPQVFNQPHVGSSANEHIVVSTESEKLVQHTALETALNLCNSLSERVLLCGCLLSLRFPNPAFSMAMLRSEADRLSAGNISYSALQQSLDQGYVSVVPDLTGNAESMMYQVTPIGQRYAQSLCKQAN